MDEAHPSPLTQFRTANGLTLEALGESLAVDKSTVLRWERGSTPIPVNKLAMIAEVTGIPREKLRPDIFGEAA